MIFLSSFGVLGLFVVSWEALVGRAKKGNILGCIYGVLNLIGCGFSFVGLAVLDQPVL